MFFSYCSIFLLLSTFVNTQSLSDEISSLPSCSDSCLDTATSTLGCSIGDYSCFCADESGNSAQSSTVSNATTCIQDSCSLIDASTTLKVVGQICVLINDPTSSSSSSSLATSSASSSSTTSSQSSTTSSNAVSSTSMASTSVTATATLIALASSPSSTSTSSNNSSGKGMSDVAKAMIVLAVAALLLILAVGAWLLWRRRRNQKNSSTRGKFKNLDEDEEMGKTPVELQGNDTQIFKWGGIGVRKSFRVHTQRITSYMSPTSPKNRNRDESWGEPRGLLSTIDENLRGVGQSPEPVGRIDTSPVRWPSTSTANSPTSPEMVEPRGDLFPPHHSRNNSNSRESLPPILPALDLPSITLSTTSRPNTPHQSLPRTPPPPEVPVKTIARLDGPFSDFPHNMPPSPRTVGISYGALARSLSVAETPSSPRALQTRSRHSISSIPNTPRTPTAATEFASPTSPPLQSPSAQSFQTFGARYSTHSQASVSTFQTFPISPQDITEVPPLPNIPSIYPTSPYPSLPPSLPTTSESSRHQTGKYYHSKQTSISKVKPKMIYLSNTPGISIVPSDSIFATPEPILHFPPSNNPFLTQNEEKSSKPVISIKPVIDRFDTVSSCGSQSSSGKSNLKPHVEELFQEGPEKKRFQERQEERRMKRKERLMHGQGSGDLGERVTSWYDATG
ncbi:hypothetical protein BCON_0005g00990 [Botryotinia convoluta]|uniref:CFEM domain-containing protein n=1 Tax=Botryotinia convoluta TaxID=54673 RepID=A0A4Z1ITX3_9HELO|nr:hypothetical protein BCON_0005g00990 [Botryotinia convoluta]